MYLIKYKYIYLETFVISFVFLEYAKYPASN